MELTAAYSKTDYIKYHKFTMQGYGGIAAVILIEQNFDNNVNYRIEVAQVEGNAKIIALIMHNKEAITNELAEKFEQIKDTRHSKEDITINF